jgi:hypothetical protein
VVEDLMVVEVVASLPITQLAQAPTMGPLSPMLAAPAVHDALCGSPHTDGLVLDSSWDNAMVSFIDTFKLLLNQPLMCHRVNCTSPRTPKAVGDDDFIPKRSARLGAKSKF